MNLTYESTNPLIVGKSYASLSHCQINELHQRKLKCIIKTLISHPKHKMRKINFIEENYSMEDLNTRIKAVDVSRWYDNGQGWIIYDQILKEACIPYYQL